MVQKWRNCYTADYIKYFTKHIRKKGSRNHLVSCMGYRLRYSFYGSLILFVSYVRKEPVRPICTLTQQVWTANTVVEKYDFTRVSLILYSLQYTSLLTGEHRILILFFSCYTRLVNQYSITYGRMTMSLVFVITIVMKKFEFWIQTTHIATSFTVR